MDHVLRRECARADRNGEVFSLVLFRVRGRGRRRAKSAHRLARVMLKRSRVSDEVGWVGAEHLGALLTDTGPEGARAFADGVCETVAKTEARPAALVYAYPLDRATVLAAADIENEAVIANAAVAGRIGAGARPLAAPAAARNSYAVAGGGGGGAGRFEVEANVAAGATSGPTLTFAQRSGADGANAAGGHNRPPAFAGAAPVHGVEELLTLPMSRTKRAVDVVCSILLMIVLAPVFAVAAAAIKFSSPGPVIFKQRRCGLGGKVFHIYKFRTMVVGAEKRQAELRKFNEQDGPAFKLTHDPRVTRVGHFLRKTSIDELPQLLNILRGEMSLVGPRPLPVAEQEGCEQWQRHRLNVTPGITCIWQVKGRSEVSFADWVRMDVEYIRRRTILHDLSILFSTVPSVLLRRGAR